MTPEQTVDRYTVTRNDDGLGFSNGIEPDAAGGFVRYEDYLAQREQIAALEKQVQAAEHFAACHDAHDALDANDMDLRIDAYALVVIAKAALRAMGEQT